MIFKRKYFMIFDLGSSYCGALTVVKILSISCIIIISAPYCTTMSSLPIENELEGTPEGYYAFVEAPKMEPPQVKLPPYIRLNIPCTSNTKRAGGPNGIKRSLNNLCGDLNKGAIPANPMNQNIYGTPYPFELIKNKTLEFFSRTLPILKADETIPKVATLQAEPQYYLYQQPSNAKLSHQRVKRNSTNENTNENVEKKLNHNFQIYDLYKNVTQRQSRKFCDNDRGILCLLYKLVQGQVFRSLVAQKRQDPPHLEYRTSAEAAPTPNPMVDGPPTPCPAKVEYATPVFARNYQGIWRYVVQIPYEGYFTQTIEVTKCINSKCHYMDGGCLSSPRWVSLLVAEIYYPETITPINRRPPVHRSPVMSDDPPPINDFHNYQQYLHKRAVPANSETKPNSSAKKVHCDGMDELGCFQVRLYYDWFLVPGSCKCWRPDYFSKYMRWSRDASSEF